MDTVDEQFQEADPPPARRLNRLRKARSSPINHNARNVQLELTETTALAPATLSSDLSHPKSHQLTDDGQSPPRIQETEGSQVPVAEEVHWEISCTDVKLKYMRSVRLLECFLGWTSILG